VRRAALLLVVAWALLSAACTALRENATPEAEDCPEGGCASPADKNIASLQCPPAPACNCSPVRVIAPKAECPAATNESDSLLAYFGRVRKLAVPELAREYESVRQLFSRARTDSNRVRYAMLLSVPGTAFNDENRALETLDPLLTNSASSLHHLALLVSTQIQTQRREHELSDKLNALKSLDKSLIERGW
jgi:hypothetical protein